MPTLKQMETSRANGAKSNGPASPEGKAASSQNSLKFGLYAKSNVIRGEDPAEFEALVVHYQETCLPVGADQEALVKALIRTEWLLDRLHRLETKLWDREMAAADKYEPEDPFALASIRGRDAFKLLQRRLDSANRTFLRTRELLNKLQKQNPAPQPEESKPDTPTLGSFLHVPQEPESQPTPGPAPRDSEPRPRERSETDKIASPGGPDVSSGR